MKYLIDAVIDTNNKLIIIGDGEMYNILQKKINLCKNKNIKILKNIGDNQLPYFIKLSKCLILPSHLRSEAFGFSLVEGLMFGKPLISCDIKTGTSFINKNNSTGFVVKPRSSLSLKLAINKINSKKFNSKKISKNCKYRFNKYFTQEKMIFKYLKLYKSLFKSHDRIN